MIDVHGTDGIERRRCAAMKIIGGLLEKLREAVQPANYDWRDPLIAAGFANNLRAHLSLLDDETPV